MLAKIKEAYDKMIIPSCSEGCRLRIRRGTERVILDGDRLDPKSKMCDCIILQNDGRVFLVELKNTPRINPDDMAEKFENSGRMALTIMERCGRRRYNITCILLTKGYKKFFIMDAIAKKRIRIGGATQHIVKGKCGCFLDDFV